MDKINKWLKINKFKLNENKTKLMEVNMQSNSPFRTNSVVIIEVSSIKYLGFIIDRDLKLKQHLKYIRRKIEKKDRFLQTTEI